MSGGRPFAGLRPEIILAAVEKLGLRPSGELLALNSFENRVFRVGLETGDAVVLKFYRPRRWSDEAILEEHAFLEELAAADLPVVPAFRFAGNTLHRLRGFRYALFPARGGRSFEGGAEALYRLGALIARLHAVGVRGDFLARPRFDPIASIRRAREQALASGLIPPALAAGYAEASRLLAEAAAEAIPRLPPQPVLRLHGDLHRGNILWDDREEALLLLDFDDAVLGPPVQDLWMLPAEDAAHPSPDRQALLEGYRLFGEIADAALAWTPLLRAVRQAHWVGWIAERWRDPAFPQAFPQLAEPIFWQEHVEDLRELAQALEDPAGASR